MKRLGARVHLAVLAAASVFAACGDSKAPAPPAASPSATSAPAAANGPVWFEEAANASGVDFRHVRHLEQRFWFPEIMGAGAAWLDYDRDGRMDFFLVQSGDLEPGARAVPGDRLYHNEGGGRFRDVTEAAGIRESRYGMGCAVGDYDGDGDPDLYVTNVGPATLWRNKGDGTFEDATQEAGVGHDGWGTSTGFFDYDVDGDLDLFVVNYIRWSSQTEIDCKSTYGERDYCAPNNYNRPSQCVLYRNDGGGKFSDVSEAAGLLSVFGNGLGLALADFDGDGWLDAYVSNDGMPNQLWINQKNGRFVDRGVATGAAVNRNGAAEASMGTVPVDINDDGWVDLFITNLRGETNTVYLNKRGNFTDRTPMSGVAAVSLEDTGFGTGFADFDLDGELDLYVFNGRVGYWRPTVSDTDPYAEATQLMRGLGNAKFEEVMPRGGITPTQIVNGRGAALGDYDDDGDVDIAAVVNHGPALLLRNVAPRKGTWISVRLADERGSDVPGARVELTTSVRARHGLCSPCSSYCSSSDPRVHFGLRTGETITETLVTWPGGAKELFGALTAEKKHELRRGSGKPVAK